MNLLEIIFSLHGLKSGERLRRLVEMGVDTARCDHVQALFKQNGGFTAQSKKAFLQFIQQLFAKKPK